MKNVGWKWRIAIFGPMAAILAILLWSMVDEPVSTGAKVRGTVVTCSGGTRRSARQCTIQLMGATTTVVVYAPVAKVGEQVELQLQRRPLSGIESYAIVGEHR